MCLFLIHALGDTEVYQYILREGEEYLTGNPAGLGLNPGWFTGGWW